jgi:choline dehydrogenase-like flavoprotein
MTIAQIRRQWINSDNASIMIRDLAISGEDHNLEADILVVGGGTVGLLIAVLLSRKGSRVVVVESGGKQQIGERHPLNEVVQLGDRYNGAQDGRFRCLGGTSTRWGGALIPFMAQDLDLAAGWEARWPVDIEAFTKYTSAVERTFGLVGTSYEVSEFLGSVDAGDAAFIPRLAKWPPFLNRNVASLFRRDIESDSGPEIWLGATVTKFSLNPSGRIGVVCAKSVNGRCLSIRPGEVIVAAGAIESTRLLLIADRQHEDKLFAPHGILGRYFFDHLSAPTARVSVHNARKLNRIIGFRFEGKTMRSLRFEPAIELRKLHYLPTGFVHISFASESPSGFDALRSIFRHRQQGICPSARDVTLLASSIPWLVRALWWRVIEKRLLFAPRSTHQLHIVIEQEPLARNQIALSPDCTDLFGNPLATIDWRVGEAAADHVVALTQHFVRFWQASVLAQVARLDIEPTSKIVDGLKSCGGIYHPGGSTRMGKSASEAVVDENLRTFAVPNLIVLATSVFPTGGGANPTMMLLMAAFRLVDRLVNSR